MPVSLKFHLATAACVYKTKEKVDEVIRHRPEEFKDIIRMLDAGLVVQTTREMMQDPNAFAVDLMPFCFPEVDIFFWGMYSAMPTLTVGNLRTRFSFWQLSLDKEARDVAKEGFIKMMNQVRDFQSVKQQAEEVYRVLAADKGRLISPKTMWPVMTPAEYGVRDIEAWLRDMKDFLVVKLIMGDASRARQRMYKLDRRTE